MAVNGNKGQKRSTETKKKISKSICESWKRFHAIYEEKAPLDLSEFDHLEKYSEEWNVAVILKMKEERRAISEIKKILKMTPFQFQGICNKHNIPLMEKNDRSQFYILTFDKLVQAVQDLRKEQVSVTYQKIAEKIGVSSVAVFNFIKRHLIDYDYLLDMGELKFFTSREIKIKETTNKRIILSRGKILDAVHILKSRDEIVNYRTIAKRLKVSITAIYLFLEKHNIDYFYLINEGEIKEKK